MDIQNLLGQYAEIQTRIEEIKAEFPQLAEVEKQAESIKKEIQEYAKENGEVEGAGYQVKIYERDSWDTKKLPGFAAAYPALNELKTVIKIAAIRKAK